MQNALKFTPAGGKTTLKVTESAEEAIFSIQDTGVGISPEILPKIFEPFVQSEQTLDRSLGGLGLGLALVKGLVEQHGGSIVVNSELGKGTNFVIKLPIERRGAQRTAVVEPKLGYSKRILLIEDHEDSASSMKDLLEIYKHTVEVAFSGPEGLQKIKSFHPDLVICDIGLPGMSGYQVAEVIRADPNLKGLGLIALTGYAQAKDIEKSKAAGFDMHLAKPIEAYELEFRIKEVMGRRQHEGASA